MNKIHAGALLVIPFLIAGSVLPPYDKEPHVEEEPNASECAQYAVYMDAAIINTSSGTTATTLQFFITPSNQFK
jgi:hypothetical protein